MGSFEKLKQGLKKTKEQFVEGVNKILDEASRRNEMIMKKLDKAEGLAPALPESSVE